MQTNIVGTLIVLLYFCVMLVIGWYASSRNKSNADFISAGRSLGPWMIAAALAATEIGGGSSLGLVQQSMESQGLRSAWYIISVGIAYALLAFWAPKVRRTNVKTTAEYFRRRYGDASGILQVVFIITSLLGDTIAQYVASAVIISAMLNIDFQMALIIAAVVVTVYSALGGLWGIAGTDFMQVLLIFIGLLVVIPSAVKLAGGWSDIAANVPVDTFVLYKKGDWSYIFSLVVMYFTSFAANQITMSFILASKGPRAARHGALAAAGFNVLYAFIPALLGIIVLALVNMGVFLPEAYEDTGIRYALPMLAIEHLPPVIAGLLFVGLLSATMSTIDSSLLACGAVFGLDVYKQYLRKDASDKQVLASIKITMVLVSLICFTMALFNTHGILQLVRFSFTLKAATAFVPFVAGHYWKKASGTGAVASMLAGAATVLACDVVYAGAITIHTVFPALAVSALCFVAFSMLVPPKRECLDLAPEENATAGNEP